MDFNIGIAAVSTILGAVIGGFLSYRGGIEGVKQNYELMKTEKQIERDIRHRENRILLREYISVAMKTLNQVSKDLETFGVNGSRDVGTYIASAIVDSDWKMYLAESGLNAEEILIVKRWFYNIEITISYCKQSMYNPTKLQDKIHSVLNNNAVTALLNKL